MELNIYYSEKLNTDVATTSNLHEALQLSPNEYNRSLKYWLNDIYGFQGKVRKPIRNIDFSTYMPKSTGRQPKKDYEITIEFAKLITLNSRSEVKQRYAQWLLELERKLNNLEILTVQQVIFIQKLIELFRFVSKQKEALKNHSEKYISERLNKGKTKPELYSFFHSWRNSKLDISKEDVEERVKQFCIDNQKSISLTKRKVSKFDKIFTMDNYETLKHAVWDYLHTQDRPEIALKVAEITYKIAKGSGIELYSKNETNLFQDKQETRLKLNK